MFPLAAGNSDTAVAAGGFMSILALVALFITVVWIVFPFIVHSHFQEMKRLQRETNSHLKKMTQEVAAANLGRPAPSAVNSLPPPPPAAASKGDDVYRI